MVNTNKLIEFPKQDAYLFLTGESGKLELLVSVSNLINQDSLDEKLAIICHPHPLFQGTMNNKVVHTIHKALHSIGFTTIRFNYRGVGRSDGEYGNSIGESNDLRTIIEWVQTHKPDCKILLAGFSFGAFIAFKESKNINCMQLISVAPAVQNQDYNQYIPIQCPWLVIQGEDDEIVDPKLVFDWIDTLDKKPDVIRFPHTTHFFHGELVNLRNKIIEYMTRSKIC